MLLLLGTAGSAAASCVAAEQHWYEGNSGTNSQVTVSKAASTGERHYITHVMYSYSAEPSGTPALTVTAATASGSELRLQAYAQRSGYLIFTPPIRGNDSRSVSVAINGGGVTVGSHLWIGGFSLPNTASCEGQAVTTAPSAEPVAVTPAGSFPVAVPSPLPIACESGCAGAGAASEVTIAGFTDEAEGVGLTVYGGIALLVFLAAAYVFAKLGATR